MPGFPLNSLSSLVHEGILSVNVFCVKVYCLLYALVDVLSPANSAADERHNKKMYSTTACAGVRLLFCMGCSPVASAPPATMTQEPANSKIRVPAGELGHLPRQRRGRGACSGVGRPSIDHATAARQEAQGQGLTRTPASCEH